MDDLFTIGRLARSTGVPVKTIRFWSDLGLLPPVERTDGGYRLFDAASAARLDLIRTLRGLGLDLETVRKIVDERSTLAEVAGEHVRALDAEIRILELRRAVLRWVVAHGSDEKETRLMHDLSLLSAAERQQIIDDFVDEAFAGTETAPHIAAAMRKMKSELPAEPTSAQVEAWVELAGLVSDAAFRARVREMAVAGTGEDPRAEEWTREFGLIHEHAAPAHARGIDPASEEGQRILLRALRPDMTRAERHERADRIDLFNDARVERYWQLMAILNGEEPIPAQSGVYTWFTTALRAGA
ncbi:MerR family transcriptional regulator [Actinocorallia longicatena]|uniref:MerR family transcriptional regulator n=1 Tax=Actinocorallia longicatena TaxID=111803 RepID=A0ABP6QHT1_9ACTN